MAANGDLAGRLGDLAVSVAANVRPGQVVRVHAEVAHIELVRAVAASAYRHGARYVDVDLDDPHVESARIRYGPTGEQPYLPAWADARLRELDAQEGANVRITGPTALGLLDDLDPEDVVRATAPRRRVWREIEYRVNNTIVPGPNLGWARVLHPDLPPDAALDALWGQIARACRLDQPDPSAAWRARFAWLAERAAALSALHLDAVRLHGPGTDLVVGLPPSARWEPPTQINHRSVEHAWNLPSEEVYTSPDRARAHGRVRLTRPAVVGGRLIDDVRLTFDHGQVTEVTGGPGVEALRAFVARDAGTSRLGELALVDRDSAVAAVRQTFGVILLDENVASHIALGFAFPELVDPADRALVNESADHLDVTIGSDDVNAVGLYADGREQPLLTGGRWQI